VCWCEGAIEARPPARGGEVDGALGGETLASFPTGVKRSGGVRWEDEEEDEEVAGLEAQFGEVLGGAGWNFSRNWRRWVLVCLRSG